MAYFPTPGYATEIDGTSLLAGQSPCLDAPLLY